MSAARFVSGQINNDGLVLTREDGSTGQCGLVIVQGVTFTDNEDSTYEVTFDNGS